MITSTMIKALIADNDYVHYGIRVDTGIRYSVGDVAYSSHALYQDPDYDDDYNLIYPMVDDGINAGLYDAGEIDGTCTIGIFGRDDVSIDRAIRLISNYIGTTIHILGGDDAQCGEDPGELIIIDATVLAVFDR